MKVAFALAVLVAAIAVVSAQGPVPCTVQSVGTYADKDAKLTLRCNTNGEPVMAKNTAFPIDGQWWRWLRPKAVAPPAEAVTGHTYYMSDTGNDAVSCATAQSASTPKATSASAFPCLTAPDDVLYISGDFIEHLSGANLVASGTAGHPIIIAGKPGQTTTLYMEGLSQIDLYYTGKTYIEFRDLVIDGSFYTATPPYSADDGLCAQVKDAHITLRNIEIKDCWGNGIQDDVGPNQYINLNVHGNGRVPPAIYSPGANGIYGTSSGSTVSGGTWWDNLCYAIRFVTSEAEPHRTTNSVVDGVRIYNNGYGKGLGGASICGASGGGVVLGDTGNTVRNSLIYNNFLGVEASGLSSKVTQDIKIYNNTIYGSTGAGITVGQNAGSNNTSVVNNIVYGNGSTISLLSQTNTTQTTNLTTNPSFTSAATGDFTLLTGSAAINAGTTIASVTNDFLGVLRPIAANYDIGAYETAPLVTIAQLNTGRTGAFRVPVGEDMTFTRYGGMGYDPTGNGGAGSLYVVAKPYGGYVWEISIPAVSLSTTEASLNPSTVLQGPRSTFEGRLHEIDPGWTSGGQFVGSGVFKSGSTLLLNGWDYYGTSGTLAYSSFTRASSLSTTTLSQGPMTVSYPLNPSFASGPMAAIPATYQAALGSNTMVSGLGPAPIITRTSQGPALFAWNASDMIAGTTPITSLPLIYYTAAHPTLGTYQGTCGSTVAYCTPDVIGGMAFLTATRTVVFIGSHSTANYDYCTGTSNIALAGTPVGDGSHYCYDPLDSSKGEHGYPYYAWAWLYDVNDLIAVYNGTKNPWDVVPYENGALSAIDAAYTTNDKPQFWGAGYDPTGKRLFIAHSAGAGTQPIFHVIVHP